MSQYSLFLALLVGIIMPFQAPINAVLGRSLGHPLWATLVSLLVSALLVLPLLLSFKVPMPNLAYLGKLPWWAWIGGSVGMIFVASAVVLAPKMGIANFTVMILLGQAVGALLLDHFGLFGLEQRAVNWYKIAGVLIMVGGVLLVQYGAKVQQIQSVKLENIR